MPADRKQYKPIDSVWCDVCGKYISKKESGRHKKTHGDFREEFACGYPGCKYTSLQRSNVADHYVAIHTVDTPHTCGFLGPPVCNLAFATSSKLCRHKKDEHGKHPSHMYAKQPGKLDKYYQYVLSPEEVLRRAASSPSYSSASSTSFASSSSSSSASCSRRPVPSPAPAPCPVPASAVYGSTDLYCSPDAMAQASLAQLAAMHPANHSHLSKQMPLDLDSFDEARMYIPHPGTWPGHQPLYNVQNAYGVHQLCEATPQVWPVPSAPRYGYPAEQW